MCVPPLTPLGTLQLFCLHQTTGVIGGGRISPKGNESPGQGLKPSEAENHTN